MGVIGVDGVGVGGGSLLSATGVAAAAFFFGAAFCLLLAQGFHDSHFMLKMYLFRSRLLFALWCILGYL
jgi:hypothetical protein